jgi:hypothetical protein
MTEAIPNPGAAMLDPQDSETPVVEFSDVSIAF